MSQSKHKSFQYTSSKMNDAFFALFKTIMEKTNSPACLPHVFVDGERLELERIIENISAATEQLKGVVCD